MRRTWQRGRGGMPEPLPHYFIKDDFTDARAAGAVGGTGATPGPGARGTGEDTESKMSVGSGVLLIEKHTVDGQNVWLTYATAIARANGVTLRFRIRHTANGGQFHVTLDAATAEPAAGSGQIQFRSQGAGVATRFICGSLNNTNLADTFPALNQWGEYAIVLKNAGAILYKWNGSSWSKIVERSDGVEVTLYLHIANFTTVAAASQIEVDYLHITNRPPVGISMPS